MVWIIAVFSILLQKDQTARLSVVMFIPIVAGRRLFFNSLIQVQIFIKLIYNTENFCNFILCNDWGYFVIRCPFRLKDTN